MAQPRGNLHLTLEPLGAEVLSQIRVEQLDRNGTAVLQVFSQVDRCHAPASDLTLQPVAVAESGLQSFLKIGSAVGVGGHGENIAPRP